jgi:ankyrin repeat protein
MDNPDIHFEILKHLDAVIDWKHFSDAFPSVKQEPIFWKRLQKIKLFDIINVIELDWLEAIKNINIDYTYILLNDYNNISETMLQLLLSKNARIEGENISYSPLVLAIANNNYKLVKLLIKYKAPINPSETDIFYDAPLHAACSLNSTNIVRYLLEHGADPNVVGWAEINTVIPYNWSHEEFYDDVYGLVVVEDTATPIFIAILKENVEIIRLLLEFGADKTYESHQYSETPMTLALRSKNKNVIDLLVVE